MSWLDGNKNSSVNGTNSEQPAALVPSSQSDSACPMKSNNQSNTGYKNPSVYNVYSQKLDPKNQMPSSANQQPSPEQEKALSTHRQPSSIKKAGAEGESTWIYPSPQMFWNALARKDKLQGVQEDDMDTVIAIHNNMNEVTWLQVLEWEKLREKKGLGMEPKLLRFLGRPDDFSPKAQLKMLFGYPAPFDRHDWTVDRGGEEVRYVIDYYHDESAVDQDEKPKSLTDASSMKSIKVDVRPALDTPQSLFDRIFAMPLLELQGRTAYNPPDFFPASAMVKAEVETSRKLMAQWDTVQTSCEQAKNNLLSCDGEDACRAASVALQRCTANVVCPSVVADFDTCVNCKPANLDKTGVAYSAMVKCLEMFEVDLVKEMEKKKSQK